MARGVLDALRFPIRPDTSIVLVSRNGFLVAGLLAPDRRPDPG